MMAEILVYKSRPAAKQFAVLTGKITLSRTDLNKIRTLDYEVRVKEQTL